MVYLDTNILIYARVEQDLQKKEHSIDLIERLVKEDRLLLSTLVIQEYVFALAKLGLPYRAIRRDSMFYMGHVSIGLDSQIMRRSVEACCQLEKCRNINDISHLFLAEKAGAKYLLTYDSDFKTLERLSSSVTIKILP